MKLVNLVPLKEGPKQAKALAKQYKLSQLQKMLDQRLGPDQEAASNMPDFDPNKFSNSEDFGPSANDLDAAITILQRQAAKKRGIPKDLTYGQAIGQDPLPDGTYLDKDGNKTTVARSKAAFTKSTKFNRMNEITTTPVSGTKAGFISDLNFNQGILKNSIKVKNGSSFTGFISIDLPKGTEIKNLPGGVFAKHPELENLKDYRSFGLQITKNPENLSAIENNSNIINEMAVNEMATFYKVKGDKAEAKKAIKQEKEKYKEGSALYNTLDTLEKKGEIDYKELSKKTGKDVATYNNPKSRGVLEKDLADFIEADKVKRGPKADPNKPKKEKKSKKGTASKDKKSSVSKLEKKYYVDAEDGGPTDKELRDLAKSGLGDERLTNLQNQERRKMLKAALKDLQKKGIVDKANKILDREAYDKEFAKIKVDIADKVKKIK